MMLEMMASLYLNECPLLQSGVDPFILFEVGEEETMSCFQVLTLQEQYGDCLEQQVPLDPSIITYDELRYLKVLHFGYDGLFHVGELIVNVKVADEVLDIFKQLYLMRYPIEKLRLMSYRWKITIAVRLIFVMSRMEVNCLIMPMDWRLI